MLKNLIIASALALAPTNSVSLTRQVNMLIVDDKSYTTTVNNMNYESNAKLLKPTNETYDYTMLSYYNTAVNETRYQTGDGYYNKYILIEKITNQVSYSIDITQSYYNDFEATYAQIVTDAYLKVYVTPESENAQYTTYAEDFLQQTELTQITAPLENYSKGSRLELYAQSNLTASVEITNSTAVITNLQDREYDITLEANTTYYVLTSYYLRYDTSDLVDFDFDYLTTNEVPNHIKQYVSWEPPENTGEIVDIPGLMFTILGMPFAFLSQAFDLTIFPGTLYAVNVSHIFVALISALILIVVIKKILK